MKLKELFEIFKAPRADLLSDAELEAAKNEHAQLQDAYARWKEKSAGEKS